MDDGERSLYMAMCGLLLLLFFFISGSLWLRIHRFRQSLNHIEPKATYLSMAIQELAATAGGVYLSLITLISFLKISLPPQIIVGSVSLDPLATISFGLAIIQPVLQNLYGKLEKGIG